MRAKVLWDFWFFFAGRTGITLIFLPRFGAKISGKKDSPILENKKHWKFQLPTHQKKIDDLPTLIYSHQSWYFFSIHLVGQNIEGSKSIPLKKVNETGKLVHLLWRLPLKLIPTGILLRNNRKFTPGIRNQKADETEAPTKNCSSVFFMNQLVGNVRPVIWLFQFSRFQKLSRWP